MVSGRREGKSDGKEEWFMTVGGWLLWGFIGLGILVVSVLIGYAYDEAHRASRKGKIIGLVVGLALGGLSLMPFRWYFTRTETGKRAVKSQESNFGGGIKRKVVVYSMDGKAVAKYEGKFDIEYNNDRILFDDENGLRHIIYYPTGTVIIDEVG